MLVFLFPIHTRSTLGNLTVLYEVRMNIDMSPKLPDNATGLVFVQI
jgi:hypothetical protein